MALKFWRGPVVTSGSPLISVAVMEKALNSKDHISRKFVIGQMLDIEVPGPNRQRFQSMLVGMKPGAYLVTELPSLTRHGNLRDHLLERQQLIVRTLCDKTTGECLGFKSYIQAKLNKPDQLMFMTFPNSVQVHELREEKRMLVLLEAKLVCNQGNRVIFGTLTDLSNGGCRFEYGSGSQEKLNRDEAAEISFEHPESGRIENRVVRIRSVRGNQGVVVLGMSFEKEASPDQPS